MGDIVELTSRVSWPQVVLLIAFMGYMVVSRRTDRKKLESVAQDAQVSAHAVVNNSGTSLRDAVDRIEEKLDTHITEDQTWKSQAEDLLTRGD